MRTTNMLTTLGMCAGILLFLGGAGGDGCSSAPSSDDIQHQAQEQLSKESNMQVGMPAISHFGEKRMMKSILEDRDAMVPTYTYLYDFNGHVGDKLCDSLGYALPGGTQYTNPQAMQHVRVNQGDDTWITNNVLLPQADPNGLFSPSTSEGTYIMCKDPHSPRVAPVYSEPQLIVSPFALK